jgi:hypothetical protein
MNRDRLLFAVVLALVGIIAYLLAIRNSIQGS